MARSHTQIEAPPFVDRSVHDYVGVIDPGIVDRMEQSHAVLFDKTEVEF